MPSLQTQSGPPEERLPDRGRPVFPPRAPLPDSSADFHPLLLAQLQDDLARSRKREAFWISVVVHIVAIVAIVLATKYLPSGDSVKVATAEDLLHNKELTYLEAPPDNQKPPVTAPDTKFMSDKNRIATSRAPSLDRKTLDELRDARRPGPPVPAGPPIQQQQQAQQSAPQLPTTQQSAAARPGSLIAPPNTQSPLTARSGNPFGGPVSAGSAIAEAARNSARAGYGATSGDYGIARTPSGGKIKSDMDVLSDTMGVDFGPYLSRVVQAVRMNWYTLIPEAAQPPLLKKGKVSLEFAILKDGRVAGMRIADGSGDVSLDRAAWGGITASNPFAPLPAEFRGPYLALRFHFYYNPDKKDLQ